jgi:GT2 family glycosyltransferase
MTGPLATFVVCTHNNRSIIDSCLGAIRAQTLGDHEVIVYDDASSDGTPDHVARNYPEAKVIRGNGHLGPSFGRNHAARRATGRYLVFLDSDVTLCPGWLRTAFRGIETGADAGVVGGKLLYTSDAHRVNAFGGVLGKIGLGWNGLETEMDVPGGQPIACLWVSSAAMLVSRDLFEELGGFDETFFYGAEDSDLGWRANLLGHRVISLPDAVAFHRVSDTVGVMGEGIVFHYCKNRTRSLLKNYGTANLLLYLPPHLLYSLLDALARAPRAPKLRALAWNLRNLGDTLRHRSLVQRQRRSSDADLEPLFSPRWFPPIRLSQRKGWMEREASGISDGSRAQERSHPCP